MSKIEKEFRAMVGAGKSAVMTAKKIKAAIAASARIEAAPHAMKHVLLSISTRKILRQKMRILQGNNQIGPSWQKIRSAYLKALVPSRLVEIAAGSGGQKRQRLLDKINRMAGGGIWPR